MIEIDRPLSSVRSPIERARIEKARADLRAMIDERMELIEVMEAVPDSIVGDGEVIELGGYRFPRKRTKLMDRGFMDFGAPRPKVRS